MRITSIDFFRRNPVTGLAALLVVILLAVSLTPFAAGSASPSSASGNVVIAGASTAPLSVNWSAPAVPLWPNFWGTDVRPYSAIGSSQASWWQATPLEVAVWPGGAVGDGYNYTTGVITNPGGNTYLAPQSTSQFVAWCRSVGCQAVLQVPGEIDQPATAAYYVAYTEKTLGFRPAYWEIGNEPGLWQNFGLPWSQWGSTTGRPVTPSEYAQVVRTYISAMLAVDPTARFVGLPGTGIGASQETTWIGDTVSVNGPNLSAIAIHVYPAGRGNGTATLAGFFGSLGGKGSLAIRVPADRAAIRVACPKCAPIALFVTESNAGISGGIWDTYMATYPEVPYMAAQLIQAVETGVSNLDLFSFEGAYPGSLFTGSGSAQPIDALYATILSHFGTDAYPTRLGTTEQGAYALASVSGNGSTASLLIVNANASTALTVTTAGAGFPASGPATFWSWNETSSSPKSWSTSGGVPASITVPPSGVTLISVSRSQGGTPAAQYPVVFSESGLPAGTSWMVSLAGTNVSSTGGTVVRNLTNGSYPFVVHPAASYYPTPSSGSVAVAGSGMSRSIQFALEGSTPTNYSVAFEPTGPMANSTWSVDLGGSVLAGSSTLGFSEPNGTYPFSIVPPAGRSANPSNGTAKVAGSGLVVSVSFPSAGTNPDSQTIQFVPSGLGANGIWSVSLTGQNVTGSGTLEFAKPNGSYGFVVTPTAGFSAKPASGTVAVVGENVSVPVVFGAISSSPPAKRTYPVEFVARGLPSATPWSVTIGNGTTNISGAGENVGFELPNGTYSYELSGVSGFVPTVPTGTIVVAGTGWTLNATFVLASPGPAPVTAGPQSMLGLVQQSGLFIALMGIVASGAVYAFERGFHALRGRRVRPRSSSTDGPQRPTKP